jgi:SAM-dependent methyltransferase
MREVTADNIDYGNWVPWKFILTPAFLSLLFGSLAIFFPVLWIAAAFFLLCFLYFAYARYIFSPKGGDVQARIQDLVLTHMGDWDGTGKVLDIGCGNGALTIRIAQRYPLAEIIGIDYWGKAWEYSKGICESNASIEGVAERVTFHRASASSLPFDDEAFDVSVSNMVFHEVRDTRDKLPLIKEALRVVKKGGYFIWQDLFLWKLAYGEPDELIKGIKDLGVEAIELVDTSNSEFIPTALKLPFMVGTAGILFGRK